MGWTQNADGTVTDDRTGLNFASVAVGQRLGYGDPVVLKTNPASPSYNQPSNDQKGSEWWMNSDYTGAQPSRAVKALYTDANLAYQYAQTAITNMQKSLQQQGQSVSPEVMASVGLTAAAQPKTPTASLAPAPFNLDLSALQPEITWVQNNILVVVIALVAVLILPRLIGSSSGRRS